MGEWRYSSTHSLTSALDGGGWTASRPGRFTSRERAPSTHWKGSWVGPRAILDAVVKRKIPSPRRESNPRTPIVQPVAQRYTYWSIRALVLPTLMPTKWCAYNDNHISQCLVKGLRTCPNIEALVFWVILACSVVFVHQLFGGPCCLINPEDGGSNPPKHSRRPRILSSPPWKPQISLVQRYEMLLV
jgi:hypothetical protein